MKGFTQKANKDQINKATEFLKEAIRFTENYIK
jgi:hypothetical protein